jgi:hypothetical protein
MDLKLFRKHLENKVLELPPFSLHRVKPKSPHLNGKVERTQLADLEEFYTIADIKDP